MISEAFKSPIPYLTPKISFLLTALCLGELGDGLSVFQGVYLVGLGWNEGSVGVALSLMSLACLICQPWAGDWLDRTTLDRRLILVAVSLVTAVTTCSVLLVPHGNKDHMLVFISKIIDGISAAFFEPCLAALTLACFGPSHFDKIMASNLLWGHVGAVIVAIAAGLVSFLVYPHVKYCFLVLCFSSLLAFFFIQFLPEGNPNMGRGFSGDIALDENNQIERQSTHHDLDKGGDNCSVATSYQEVIADKRTILLSISGFFFHFANANVLLVLGELMGGDTQSGAPKRSSIPMIATAVVVAQSFMVLATWAADVSTTRGVGRKPLFMVGLMALPLRCWLILILQNAGDGYLLCTQVLDGIGAGLISIIHPFLIADITFETGRFNLILGLTFSCFGLGSTLSDALGQWAAEAFGYQTTLLASFVVSIFPIVTFAFMPETIGVRAPKPDPMKEIEAVYINMPH